jgi:hypothetical protein
MRNDTSSNGVEVNVDHHLEEIGIRFDTRGFEAIHNNLAASSEAFVNHAGKTRINEAEEIGEEA